MPGVNTERGMDIPYGPLPLRADATLDALGCRRRMSGYGLLMILQQLQKTVRKEFDSAR